MGEGTYTYDASERDGYDPPESVPYECRVCGHGETLTEPPYPRKVFGPCSKCNADRLFYRADMDDCTRRR